MNKNRVVLLLGYKEMADFFKDWRFVEFAIDIPISVAYNKGVDKYSLILTPSLSFESDLDISLQEGGLKKWNNKRVVFEV